jgi:hypothetical protein
MSSQQKYQILSVSVLKCGKKIFIERWTPAARKVLVRHHQQKCKLKNVLRHCGKVINRHSNLNLITYIFEILQYCEQIWACHFSFYLIWSPCEKIIPV